MASPGRALAPRVIGLGCRGEGGKLRGAVDALVDEALVVLLSAMNVSAATRKFWRRMGSSVMHSRERRAREIQSQIADILLHDWDPIGVADVPQARDEYDSYVGGVYRVLASGGSLAEIEAHLRDIEVRMMGLDKTTHEADVARATAARRLAALDVRLERAKD